MGDESLVYDYEVAEVVPLKQGLKLAVELALVMACVVAEVVPLKQGLKL